MIELASIALAQAIFVQIISFFIPVVLGVCCIYAGGLPRRERRTGVVRSVGLMSLGPLVILLVGHFAATSSAAYEQVPWMLFGLSLLGSAVLVWKGHPNRWTLSGAALLIAAYSLGAAVASQCAIAGEGC